MRPRVAPVRRRLAMRAPSVLARSGPPVLACRDGRRPRAAAAGRAAGAAAIRPGSPRVLRREILVRLRRDGPASPDQLAVAIGASRTGVLQQLRALEATTSSAARRSATASAGRATCTTSRPTPRSSSRRTTTASPAGLLAAIGAVGGEALVEQVFQARRRQIGDRVRRELDERVGADAPLVDRVRALAVLQDEQGYLADAADRRGRHDPPARAQLRDPRCRPGPASRLRRGARPVPRGPRRRRRPRDAHRERRPLLLVPGRGAGRTESGAEAVAASADGGG